MTTRIAVFASGGGSNMDAIANYFLHQAPNAATVALIVTNRLSAGALARGAVFGIENHVLDNAADGREILRVLAEHRIDLVALAGYLKQIPPAVTHDFHGRMLNIHPALLPAFGGEGMYGEKVHAAAIAAGVRISGATVHFVDEHYDRGPIVSQWPVAVAASDTPASLAARVLKVEHTLYPRTIAAVATGAVRLGDDGRVHGSFKLDPQEIGVFAPL